LSSLQGLELALDTILDAEQRLGTSGKQRRAHHILVLLSDGVHNVGPEPEASAPAMAAALKAACPGVQLSVVVVGVSARSNTAMGMALKTHLETVGDGFHDDGLSPSQQNL
jgi:Mg-chelatase subunit ChlD